jgi:hypothetical protein
MTGSICRIGAAIKKADPTIKVSYMPGVPFTFVYSSKKGGTKCGTMAAYCKSPDAVAAQIKTECAI